MTESATSRDLGERPDDQRALADPSKRTTAEPVNRADPSQSAVGLTGSVGSPGSPGSVGSVGEVGVRCDERKKGCRPEGLLSQPANQGCRTDPFPRDRRTQAEVNTIDDLTVGSMPAASGRTVVRLPAGEEGK